MIALAGATCVGGLTITGSPAAAGPAAPALSTRKVDGLAPIAGAALAELYHYSESASPSDLAVFEVTRDAIAVEIAHRLDIEPSRMQAAWANADLAHQTALLAALTQLGTPYRRNTSKPGVGFDCSGLTTFAWGVAGTELTRQSGAQIKAAAPRTIDTAQAGDLMYYPGHAMLYLGVDRAMVHSPYSGRTVEVDTVSSRRNLKFGNPIG